MTQESVLRLAIFIFALVPISAGLHGVITGLDSSQPYFADNHYRYLSGILLGIGLVFWAGLYKLKAFGPAFKVLTIIVFIGGMARFLTALMAGWSSSPLLYFSLLMELAITPLLYLDLAP